MPGAFVLPSSIAGFRVHLVGIKGTGMTALAEVLSARGARISGSDTGETFYTDAILKRLGIPYAETVRRRQPPCRRCSGGALGSLPGR